MCTSFFVSLDGPVPFKVQTSDEIFEEEETFVVTDGTLSAAIIPNKSAKGSLEEEEEEGAPTTLSF